MQIAINGKNLHTCWVKRIANLLESAAIGRFDSQVPAAGRAGGTSADLFPNPHFLEQCRVVFWLLIPEGLRAAFSQAF